MNKGEATRQNILDRAMSMASSIGLEGLSIGKLASELSLSKSGLFAHFQSKEALQIQVLDAAAREFTRLVIEPIISEKKSEKRFALLYDLWLGWGRNTKFPGGCIFAAAAIELDDQPGPVRDRLVQLQRGWIETMERLVRTAIEEGYFSKAADPARFAQEAYSIMLGLNFYARLLRDSKAEPRARETYRQLVASYRAGVSQSKLPQKKKK